MQLQKILFSAVAVLAFVGLSIDHSQASMPQPATTQQYAETQSNNQEQNQPSPSTSNASLNWSGYVANQSGKNYTSVNGSWTVPTVTPDSAATADATWVGIGGVSSRDLIQAGTQAIVEDGGVAYSAWIETLPNYSETVPLEVHSGDSITASVTEESTGQWLITITNNTTGKQFNKTVAYDSSRSSAEWVEEMVSNGNGTFRALDNFGSVRITQASATVDGQPQNLAQLQAKPLNMVTSGQQTLASVTSNSDTGFTVTRGATVADTGGPQRWYVVDQSSPNDGPVPVTIIIRRHHDGYTYTSESIGSIPLSYIMALLGN